MQRFWRAYLAYVVYFTAVMIGMGFSSAAGVIPLLLFGRNDWIDTGFALVVFAAIILPILRAARLVVRGLTSNNA